MSGPISRATALVASATGRPVAVLASPSSKARAQSSATSAFSQRGASTAKRADTASGSIAQADESAPKSSRQQTKSCRAKEEARPATTSSLRQRPPLKRSLTMEAEALTASFAASQSPEAVQSTNIVGHSKKAPSGDVPPATKRTRESATEHPAANATGPENGQSLEMRNRELVASVVRDWLSDLLPASVQEDEERFGQIYTVAYKVRPLHNNFVAACMHSHPNTFFSRLLIACFPIAGVHQLSVGGSQRPGWCRTGPQVLACASAKYVRVRRSKASPRGLAPAATVTPHFALSLQSRSHPFVVGHRQLPAAASAIQQVAGW
eukprot:INCI631.1.p1 GENE.INCI631.1~~INCI631.1.p1  ORF type:complete len:322 (+),score=44.43 INCI631.1:903-1868(+)